MISIDNHWLRTASRRFWGLVFTFLITVAVFVQLGRQAFPVLTDYQAQIAKYLGDTIGMVVTVDSLDASWSSLRPKLMLSRVEVKSKAGEPVFKIASATLELSLVNSIFDWRLSWRQMSLDGFETTLFQSDDGTWSIKGMPKFERSEGEERFRLDDPYDVFLFGRRIKISEAKFNLRYLSQENTTIEVPSISIDNDRDFHRIKASLDVDGGEKAADFLVEGHGDPRDSDFIAHGFLQLKNFPTTDVLDALALAPVRQEHEQKLNLKLWFRGDASKGTTLSGMLETSGKLDLGDKKFTVPDALETTFYGEITEDQNWAVTFKQLVAEWQGKRSPPLDVAVYGDFRKFGGLRIPALDAQVWSELALTAGLGSSKAENIIKRINPRGLLKNLDFAITEKDLGYFQLRAYVENGYSDAFKGAPAFNNISGFVSANLQSGSFDVDVRDGLKVDLPKVYNEPLAFDEASGQIRWKIDLDRRVSHISSGLLRVVNPDEQASGYFNLFLPFSKARGEQKLTLAIGVSNTLAKNHEKYVPKTVPDDLYAWLGDSVKQGKVANAGFLYHGSVEKNSETSPSIQLQGDVIDGRIRFDPAWPELSGMQGSLALDNQALDITIHKASLLGNAISGATVSLLNDSELALGIKGELLGNVESAMGLIDSSPIKQNIGSTFDTWEAQGEVQARLDLHVPLVKDSENYSHTVEITFGKVDLNITDLSLVIDKLSGKLFHDSEKGLFADKLEGEIWGRPFVSHIRSPENTAGSRDVIVEYNGDVGVDDLYQWTQRPELRFMEGVSSVKGSLYIPLSDSGETMEMKVNSDMRGVAINLPNSFGKTKEQPVELDTRIQFYDYGEQYQFSYGEKLRLALLATKNNTTSAKIEINKFSSRPDVMPRLADNGRFEVVGQMGTFDLDAWNKVLEDYLGYVDEVAVVDEETSWFPVSLVVEIDTFLLGDFEITGLVVNGERQPDFWNLAIHSDMMSGIVRVPEDDRPIALDLDYLRIESERSQTSSPEPSILASPSLQTMSSKSVTGKDELGLRFQSDDLGMSPVSSPFPAVETTSAFADADLSEVVALDFVSREFSLDGANFGAWKFKLRPIENGIVLSDIVANVRGLKVGSEQEGAEFTWTKNLDGQHSRFKGNVGAQNLAKVFEEFNQEKLLVSEKASIAVDAQWPGAPDQATLETLKGVIRVNIRNGSFTRGAGSDENALLRLIALFNFDTILRRLRLDFSDLAAQGYAYDKIYGSFDFSDGKIFLTDPLIVKSSSSYLQLVGTVDLIDETLDSEMVVTLPVASNVALATAVIVGLPAALGVYVMSKLFKKQVDRASSLNVGVSGKWVDPKVKIKDIFDLDAASRKGKEIKERAEIQEP